jgi:hypothetical protein
MDVEALLRDAGLIDLDALARRVPLHTTLFAVALLPNGRIDRDETLHRIHATITASAIALFQWCIETASTRNVLKRVLPILVPQHEGAFVTARERLRARIQHRVDTLWPSFGVPECVALYTHVLLVSLMLRCARQMRGAAHAAHPPPPLHSLPPRGVRARVVTTDADLTPEAEEWLRDARPSLNRADDSDFVFFKEGDLNANEGTGYVRGDDVVAAAIYGGVQARESDPDGAGVPHRVAPARRVHGGAI